MSNSLWDDQVGKLRERIAATTPTPGGGAVAAVTAAFAIALLRMVCGISMKKLAASERGGAEALLVRLRQSEEALARSADEDVQAFDAYISSRKSGSEAESEALLLRCADVPMSAAESVAEANSLLPQIDFMCPSFARSDLATASNLLRASQASLLANVETNLDAIHDEAAKSEMKARYDRLVGHGGRSAAGN